MHAQLLSHVWLFATPWTVACQASLSVGFFQARISEWVASSSFSRFSWPRDWTCVSCISRQIHYYSATYIFFLRLFPLIGYYKMLNIVPVLDNQSLLIIYFMVSSTSQLLWTFKIFFNADHFKSLYWIGYNIVSILCFGFFARGMWDLDQGWSLHPLHWKAKTYPLELQGSPILDS